MPQTESQEGYMDKRMISLAFNTYFYMQINLYTLETHRVTFFMRIEKIIKIYILFIPPWNIS